MKLLDLVINIIVILYIWIDTNAIIEWARLLRLDFFFKYKEYDEFILRNVHLKSKVDYPTWVSFKYSNFFTRLTACPICLTVWLNIIGCLIFFRGKAYFLVGVAILLTLIGYHALKLIIKKTNV